MPGELDHVAVNLEFMRRRDPDVEEILGSSPHVTMYTMPVDLQKWERSSVEGTLFVLKRRTNPRFQIMILNKLSTENYTEAIEFGFHSEVSPPYLIYTQGGGKVHGLWFFESGDLEKIYALLHKVEAMVPKLAGGPPSPVAPQPVPAAVPAAVDGAGDDAFWDKPAAKQAAPPAHHAQLAAAPAPQPGSAFEAVVTPQAGGNVLTNLFKNAAVKQQQPAQQAAPAPAAPPAAAPAAPRQDVVPLPPSFFLQQPQAPQAPAGPSQPPAGESALSKLFTKQAVIQTPAPQPPQPVPGGTLAALLNNAASKAASLPQPGTGPAPKPAPKPAPPAPAPQRPGPQEQLKVALSRLVQRDEFVSLLAEELRQVGLLQ